MRILAILPFLCCAASAAYLPADLMKDVAENKEQNDSENKMEISRVTMSPEELEKIGQIGSKDERKGRTVANREVLEQVRAKLVDGKLPPVAKDGIPRIDATDNNTLQQSFFDALMSLDAEAQEKFSNAWVTISVMMSDPTVGNSVLFREVMHGKSPDELIAISRKLIPISSDAKLIIDGSSSKAFGKSVGDILVSLDSSERADFSEAIAKILYDLGEDRKGEILKMLDGKNAKEVVKLAGSIKTPFDAMKRKNLSEMDIVLEPAKLSEPSEEKDFPSLDKSLSPSSAIPEHLNK